MAKKTRYPKRTSAKPAPRRAARPTSATSSERSPASTRPARDETPEERLDEPLDDMPARSTAGLTAAEEQRAAELEAELAAKERAAIAESLRRRNRGPEREHGAIDVNQPLSVRAAHEYAYVARDVKRITITAAAMGGILALLHILVNVLGVISL